MSIFITLWRYHRLPIVRYYWSMAISRGEYLVTTAQDLGAALKHFRSAAGVTQVDAAEAMGIRQPYLSSLEGGKFGSSLTHALRLLRFVGCEVIVRPREPRG
jgi:DNA-binding XRE family transcriptional regulator